VCKEKKRKKRPLVRLPKKGIHFFESLILKAVQRMNMGKTTP